MIINCLVNEGGLENLGDLVLSKSMRGTQKFLGISENLGDLRKSWGTEKILGDWAIFTNYLIS